jgi:hypothetical protein
MLARKARVATPKRRRAGSGRTARFNPQVDVAPELRRIDRIKINLTVLQAKERTIISKMNAAREETAAKLWVAPGQALRAGKKQPPVVKPRRSTRIRREDERVGVGAIGKRASQLHQELERRLARLSADAADVAEEIDRVGEHLELAVNAPLTLGDPTLSLPDEVLLVILHCLPWEMLWKGTCATVCRRWHLLLKASPTVLRRKREGRWEAYANGWLAPTVHKAHTSSVRALAIGLGGRVYSGSTDGTVRVWSGGPDPAPIQTLVGHTEGVYALAVGKDGEVYSASADLTVRVWSGGGSGKHIRTLEGHTDSVFSLAVTERRVYSGSADCTIIVWSREHGTQVGTLVGHEGHVSGLAVGEDERVYSCSSDGHIRIWAPMAATCSCSKATRLACFASPSDPPAWWSREDGTACSGSGLPGMASRCKSSRRTRRPSRPSPPGSRAPTRSSPHRPT